MSSKKLIGVVGAGSFGTALANLLAENDEVLLYARRQETLDNINHKRENLKQKLHERVQGTSNLKELTEHCDLIFPTVPSAFFREALLQMEPYLRPDHILIHGTKGFHINVSEENRKEEIKERGRSSIYTMSELIHKETVVIRVGCISGPNLAKELADHQPAGTVIASPFDEVIRLGRNSLRSPRLQVFGNTDIIGIEMAGALKNIVALASGALGGLELGDNARALLITKSLGEIIRVGVVLGGDHKSFLGLGGIGDIIATASSPYSRNYTVGYRMAKGETLEEILATSEEVAEGVNTVEVIKHLADHFRVRVPIIQMIYRALFEGMDVKEGISYLMKYPFDRDVDFLD